MSLIPGSEKSPEAFRTIREVAEDLDLPQHVLRFWESKFSQIHPVKRAGGRRYYRPQEIDLLRGIRTLLYGEGYTIKGVQKLLREQGLRYVVRIGRGESAGAVMAGDVLATHAAPAVDTAAPAISANPAISEEKREKLELLLAELVGLKQRLRSAGQTENL